jgi:hypothetical protein
MACKGTALLLLFLLLSFSQKPITGPYPQPNESNSPHTAPNSISAISTEHVNIRPYTERAKYTLFNSSIQLFPLCVEAFSIAMRMCLTCCLSISIYATNFPAPWPLFTSPTTQVSGSIQRAHNKDTFLAVRASLSQQSQIGLRSITFLVSVILLVTAEINQEQTKESS